MRLIYVLLFAIIFTDTSFGQLYSISTPTVNAVNNWNTKVYTKYNCSSNASTIGHSFAIDYTHSIISLISCYTGPGILPVLTAIRDTINIGTLPQGNYTLNYTVYISSSYSICAPYDTIINTHTFYAGPNSISELNKEYEFQISPNPLRDYFKIVSIGSHANLKKVEVLNLLGNKVVEVKEPILNSSIDVSSLPKGLYLLKLSTEYSSSIKRIMKE